jgi:alpha-L-arabinofuranosidase
MKRLGVDLVDEHYYKDPAWFLANASRYDAYDRKSPAVFAGEYACHVPGQANSFYAALCEAAFMTGLERNADLVHMATYAPLLAHVDAWQWRPDMIWFDNLRVAPTPSYHVQRLYSANKGTRILPLASGGKALAGQEGLYASAVLDETGKAYVIKIVNTSATDKPLRLVIDNLNKRTRLLPAAEVTTLESAADRVNTLDEPAAVAPVPSSLPLEGNALQAVARAGSFTVYRLKFQ